MDKRELDIGADRTVPILWIKIFIFVVGFGFISLILVNMEVNNTKVCEEYFAYDDCRRYHYFRQKCECGEFMLHLNNSMIEYQNELFAKDFKFEEPDYETINWSDFLKAVEYEK